MSGVWSDVYRERGWCVAVGDDETVDEAFYERNQAVFLLLAVLSDRGCTVGYRVDEDAEWPVVFAETPEGQLAWHVPRDELPEWIEERDVVWDGHSTEEKHRRLRRYAESLVQGERRTEEGSEMSLVDASWPPDVEVEFTHYWKEDEIDEMRDRVLNVLSHFPEFEGHTLTIGRTQQAGKAGVHPRDDPYSNRNYIRLRPGASKFTVAHELYHILTREKAIDIFALSRSPFLIDKPPSYLELPDCVENRPTVYREMLHRVASDAVDRFHDEQEMVRWFEEQVVEEIAIPLK